MSNDTAPRKPINYYEYLESPAWRDRANAAIARSGGKCQLCGGRRGLAAHHNSYKNLGNEPPEDLVALCRRCHEAFHAIRDGRTKKKVREKAKLEGRKFGKRMELLPPIPKPPSETPVDNDLVRITVTEEYLKSICINEASISAVGMYLIGAQYPPKSGWRRAALGTVVEVRESLLEKERQRVLERRKGIESKFQQYSEQVIGNN